MSIRPIPAKLSPMGQQAGRTCPQEALLVAVQTAARPLTASVAPPRPRGIDCRNLVTLCSSPPRRLHRSYGHMPAAETP